MQVHSWRCRTLAVVLCLGTGLAAQTARKPAAKPSPWKSYCHPQYGFCFKYPAGWTMLGEVFDGAGVVVAPPQKQERELWDAVTVALVIPPPQGVAEPVTIDDAIAQSVAGVRQSGQSFVTEQRQQRTVNGNPAEMVKLHYVEKVNGRAWTEELVFIEGPEWEIYSVALKTATATLPRMEPQFARIVDSWRLPLVGPPPGTSEEDGAKPKPKPGATGAAKKSSTSPNP
jgi:hypothetical protein